MKGAEGRQKGVGDLEGVILLSPLPQNQGEELSVIEAADTLMPRFFPGTQGGGQIEDAHHLSHSNL